MIISGFTSISVLILNIILDNVQQLSNFILDKTTAISFNAPNVQIAKNDSMQLTDMIMKMLPAERKKLGINKSTLWYQRKKISEGRKIKIYMKIISKVTV